MRNVLALITAFASECRAPRSVVAGRRGLALAFAGCSNLIDKFGVNCRDDKFDRIFNTRVCPRFLNTDSKRKAQTSAKLQDTEQHPFSTKKVYVDSSSCMCLPINRVLIISTYACSNVKKAKLARKPTPKVLVGLPARVLSWLLLLPICMSLPNRNSFAHICLRTHVRDFDLCSCACLVVV